MAHSFIAAHAAKKDAAAQRATAEAAAVAAATAAIETRTAVEAANGRWRTFRRWSVALVLGGLVLDYAFHEWDFLIKRSMRSVILESDVAAKRAPPRRLRVSQPQLVPTTKLTLLMGPPGCGKTTMLKDIARSFRSPVDEAGHPKEPTPCVMISIRLDATRDQLGKPNDESALLPQGISINIGAAVQSSRTIPTQAERMTHALGLFLQAASDVCEERQARGMSPEDAAPVLLLDEMHDLIKDSRYATVGGDEVFKSLALQLIGYSTNREMIRPVVAGSSGELKFTMSKTSLVSGERFKEYMLKDPSEEEVRSALEERGYSPADAAAIVEGCGTRLRMLDEPLKDSVRPTASEVVAVRENKALTEFLSVFVALGPADQQAVFALLDRIAEAEKTGQQPPKFISIPPAARAAGFSQLTFVGIDGGLSFQSRVHSRVWTKYGAAGILGPHANGRGNELR